MGLKRPRYLSHKQENQPEGSMLEAFFLPDLCNARAILILMMISEALVMALTLMDTQSLKVFSWSHFFLTSFFVQWVTLVSVSALCLLRTRMMHFSVWQAVGLSLLITQLITLSISYLSEFMMPGFDHETNWDWIIRNQLVSLIYTAMALRYFYVQSQLRMKDQAELRARLSALQANIRPHFFFNTLNTLASLIRIDPDKAEKLLVELSRLFRAVLKTSENTVTLREELALCRSYIDIEQTRLGKRLNVDWQMPDQIPDIQVPQLIVQPLLENAVYHGIQPTSEPGYIHISLMLQGDDLCIEITNSKPQKSIPSQGNGIAHRNILSRLEALYGEQTQLNIQNSQAEYRVQLHIKGQQRAVLGVGA